MPDETKDTRNGDSLAIRAMKSMRSLARIGSWAQLNNNASQPTRKPKESNETTSSWEVGEPSVVRSLLSKSGFDGSLRRSKGSKQSSSSYGTTQNRLSGEPSQLGRPSTANRFSTLSTASSLAPVSTYSGDTRTYKSSTNSDPASHRFSANSDEMEADEPVGTKRASKTASIRWDDNIETVKAKRKNAKERRGGTTVAAKGVDGSQRSSQRSLEGRQRGKLASLFPEILEPPVPPFKDPPVDVPRTPPVPSPTTTPSPTSTPLKKTRPRPQSEQMLGRPDRPQGVVASEQGDGKFAFNYTPLLYILTDHL